MNLDVLLDAARAGEAAAEEELFRNLSVRFGFFAQRHIGNKDDAQEVAQNALITVLGKYREIDFETSFGAWAHKVLRNTIGTYHKSLSRQTSRHAEWSDDDYVRSRAPDPEVEQRLRDCLRKLSRSNKRYARILTFSYQGFTAGEICRRLRLTRGNLYTSLSRARSMLWFCLEKGDLQP